MWAHLIPTLLLGGQSAPGSRWRAWDGSAWRTGTLRVWNGSVWQVGVVRRWNGSAWV